MTISEAVTTCYLLATGKTSTISTSKRNQIVGLLNFYQRRWAREPDVQWNSLYDPAYSLGNVTATDTFDLDSSTVRMLSKREGDTVRIVWTDGVGYTDYSLVNADTLKNYFYGASKESPVGAYVAQQGNQLVFNRTFSSSSSEYGGEIFVPAYVFPDDITYDNPTSDEVQVDDPDWLCTRAAAAYVRNNIALRSRYPELLAEANEMMVRMKEDNEGQISEVARPWTPFTGSGGYGGGSESDWS